jgi:hypothetical protein
MKTSNIGLLLIIIASSLLFSGCCVSKALPECENSVINSFYSKYYNDYYLFHPEGITRKNENGMFAFHFYDFGIIKSSIEVYGDCNRGTLWICTTDPNSNFHPKWFEYGYENCKGNFSFTFRPAKGMPSPPYPNFFSKEKGTLSAHPTPTGVWSGFSEYGGLNVFGAGSTPHWSPIIAGNQGELIEDIHWKYNNSSLNEVNAALAEAKPKGKQDMDDRVKTGWESVTLRGVVNRASNPYGDLDVDHLKTCNNNYGFPPSELHFPEIGADWDMYITPDKDMGYLASNVKANEVGCEIEDFTLKDPDLPQNHPEYTRRYKFRPIEKDYLQTIGRWVIDCGHPLYGDLNDGFFTEIHPPELMVASRCNNGTTRAKIIATGANNSAQLKFFIWPGPRPSPHHRLKFNIDEEWMNNTNLTMTPMPINNPNHLECSINLLGGDNIRVNSRGVIKQSCNRLYRGIVNCGWEGIDRRSMQTDFKDWSVRLKVDTSVLKMYEIGFKNDYLYQVSGMVRGENLDMSKVKIRYQRIAEKLEDWQEIGVNSDGFYTFKAQLNSEYRIRAFSPNFLATPEEQKIKVIPSDPSLLMVQVDDIIMQANQAWWALQEIFLNQNSTAINMSTNGANMDSKQVIDSKGSKLLSFMEVEFEEKKSELEVFFHVNSLIGVDGKPIQNLIDATSTLDNLSSLDNIPDGENFVLFQNDEKLEKESSTFSMLKGSISPISAQVLVEATILSGDESIGYRIVAKEKGKTDADGNIKFEFSSVYYMTGIVLFEIIENPQNPTLVYTVKSKPFEIFPDIEKKETDFRVVSLNKEKDNGFLKELTEFTSSLRHSNLTGKSFRNQVKEQEREVEIEKAPKK